MQAVLLIDFGSTFTKLTAVDLEERRILAAAQSFTTVESDVMQGFNCALEILQEQLGGVEFIKRLACSSAACGLRMVASGLVPSLTAKAAKLAAFGAGAKVIKTFSYELTDEDIDVIDDIAPDIFLLTGGTDGGNVKVIQHNAGLIATAKKPFPIVIAGNRSAAKVCHEVIASDIHPTYITENVMPELNRLNIAPAQAVIREIFLDRIVSAKGLSHEKALIEGIIMPTPASVLAALSLLSKGTEKTEGIGEIMCADLGGATTDVYSIAKGYPLNPSVMLSGLREPFEKRSVEGDIGMRYSAKGIVDAQGLEEIINISGLSKEEAENYLSEISKDKSRLPSDNKTKAMDFALAALAIRTALIRHAGELERIYTPSGAVYKQQGKDLTGIDKIILTGGALVHSNNPQAILDIAISNIEESSLVPRNPKAIVDRGYILSAMGLLSTYDEESAINIMKQYIGGHVDGTGQ